MADHTKSIAETIEGITKNVPVYDDAVQPLAKEVGKSLKTVGGVINVALLPISIMVYGFSQLEDKLKTKLEKKLSDKKPEDIVSPPLNIVGPLLDSYKYTHDEPVLEDMFINLLSYSMDRETILKAHPSFVRIISELSPDEARLLKFMCKQEFLPKIDVHYRIKGQEGFKMGLTNITDFGKPANLECPDLTPSYLNNLERLKIISVTYGKFSEIYVKEEVYEPLKEQPEVENLKKELLKHDGTIDIQKGIIKITDFGKMFLEATIND